MVAILKSGFDGTLEAMNPDEMVFDEDIEGEIVGYLAQDGYEMILVLCEENVFLRVRVLD